MKKTLLILIIGGAMITPSNGSSNASYYSSILESLSKQIGYKLDSTKEAGEYIVETSSEYPICVEYNSFHELTHVGIRLFDQKIKHTMPIAVCNFLERYFLELTLCKDYDTFNRKIDDDKFVFLFGDITSLSKLHDSLTVDLIKIEDGHYEAHWSNSRDAILSVYFPIQYELILGMPQIEYEKKLYDEIKRRYMAKTNLQIPKLREVNDSIFVSEEVSTYLIDSLSTKKYFKRDSASYSLLIDPAYMEYSLLNILREPSDLNNPILVEQRVYGFQTLNWEVSLQDWVNYFKDEDYTVYVAVEKMYETSAKVLFLAECKNLGYNHVASILVPYSVLTNSRTALKVDLTAFIPTHNVKSLFGDIRVKK